LPLQITPLPLLLIITLLLAYISYCHYIIDYYTLVISYWHQILLNSHYGHILPIH
jgi:hypothetical protein